jgi:hypothetical protein
MRYDVKIDDVVLDDIETGETALDHCPWLRVMLAVAMSAHRAERPGGSPMTTWPETWPGKLQRSRYRIASTISRIGHCGPSDRRYRRKQRLETPHSATVKSLGNVSSIRAGKARVVSVRIVDPSKFLAKPLNRRQVQPSN